MSATPEPVRYSIHEYLAREAQDALRCGIEYAEEVLARHDASLGREHRSNRMTAERIEMDIEQMRGTLNGMLAAAPPQHGEECESE